MALSQNLFKVNSFVIETIDGRTAVDLASSTDGGGSSILLIDYFEDLLSPCITMSMLLSNSNSLTSILPIRGGEKVSLNISFSLDGDEFSFEGDRALYVYKQGSRSATTTSETFALHLTSRETITNETTRCRRRYDGKIDQNVKKILNEVLLTTKFKEENIQQTANNYSFIGNTKKPFNVISWLCTKSLPIEKSSKTQEVNKVGKAKGVAGFFFYENYEGFNFKSVESLVSKTNAGTADLKGIPSYYFDAVIQENNPQNKFKIANYSFEKNSDLIKSLRSGMYSSATYFYNLYTQKFSVYQYNLKDELKNASTLGLNDEIAVSESFSQSPSRVLFRTSDIGVLDNGMAGAKQYDESQQRDIADMAKSMSRYNILFTQSLNMVVPCNINLKVGDVIFVNFPRIERSNTKESDEEQSGLYLIKELRHHIEPGKSTTSLKLIRDSYGLYGANSTSP